MTTLFTATQNLHQAAANAAVTKSQSFVSGALSAQRGSKAHYFSEVVRTHYFTKYYRALAREAISLGNQTSYNTNRNLAQKYYADEQILRDSSFRGIAPTGLTQTSYL